MEFPPSEFERTQLEKIQNGTLRPQPVFGRGFCYGIFTCDCVPRAEPDEFKRLIIEPTDASPEDLAQWRVEHKNTVTNRWLDVQCKFYNLWRLGGTKDDCIMYLRKKFSEAGFVSFSGFSMSPRPLVAFSMVLTSAYNRNLTPNRSVVLDKMTKGSRPWLLSGTSSAVSMTTY